MAQLHSLDYGIIHSLDWRYSVTLISLCACRPTAGMAYSRLKYLWGSAVVSRIFSMLSLNLLTMAPPRTREFCLKERQRGVDLQPLEEGDGFIPYLDGLHGVAHIVEL
ncbi:hypothetical protein LCGC14_2967230 [marine sediment metagenome]|uniref:Uncharacterized protein n=1 Tax=marine sediment metagenome TaxID=412755 RepID=A0A0F8XBD5_9ZZZZ